MEETLKQSTQQHQSNQDRTENPPIQHQSTKNQQADSDQSSSFPALKKEQQQIESPEKSHSELQEKPEPSQQKNKDDQPPVIKHSQYADLNPNPNPPNQFQNLTPPQNNNKQDEIGSDWDDNSQENKQYPQQNRQKYMIQPYDQQQGDYDPNEVFSQFSKSNPNQENENMNHGFQSNIYNTNRMYGFQGGRKSPSYPDSNGFYPVKNMPPNYDNVSYKNTDGRHLDEHFRRNFTKMLLERTRGMQKHTVNQIVAKQAQKIKVYANQVSIWLCIYRIVFSVEAQKIKRKLPDSQVANLIQQRLIDYLNQNPNQKKYKFVKICNRVFRSLKIKKCTGDYWLKDLFKKYQNRLNPQIQTSSLLRKLHKNQGYQAFDEDIFQTNIHTNYIELRNIPNTSYDNGSTYHAQARQKIIRKMDKAIESALTKIFHDKISQLCISSQQMKKWYSVYGKFKILNPNTISNQDQQNRVTQFLRPSISVNNVKKAQSQILNFVKLNPNCTRAKAYTFACSIVQRFNIQQLQTQVSFSNWFNKLIAAHCTIYNQFIQLRSSSNFQIPINTRQPIQSPSFIQPRKTPPTLFDL